MDANNAAWIAETTPEQRITELVATMVDNSTGYDEQADRADGLVAELVAVDGYDADVVAREFAAGKRQLATDLRVRAAELRHLAEMLSTCVQ